MRLIVLKFYRSPLAGTNDVLACTMNGFGKVMLVVMEAKYLKMAGKNGGVWGNPQKRPDPVYVGMQGVTLSDL